MHSGILIRHAGHTREGRALDRGSQSRCWWQLLGINWRHLNREVFKRRLHTAEV
jgi:hypothetical protein